MTVARRDSDEPRHTIAMSTTPAVPVAEIDVWHASTEAIVADPARVSRAREWLTPSERVRHDRFRFDHDREMFLMGRVMSRALVAQALGVAPTAWEWREGPHGRPEVAAPSSALHFNLAHSAGLVVCALAHGRTVGVDVEDLHRTRTTDPGIVARYCTPREVTTVAAPSDGWRDRFLTYWTLKEAYLKARGLGIALPLCELGFVLAPDRIALEFLGSLAGSDARWDLHFERLTDRHVMAVASPAQDVGAPAAERAVVRPRVRPFPDHLWP